QFPRLDIVDESAVVPISERPHSSTVTCRTSQTSNNRCYRRNGKLIAQDTQFIGAKISTKAR
ncbi:MAG TPA: hypothetical protein VE970_05440, partial [Pseudolabrys sp.]|nr:hypothetical protein [Pseudolabrys sp.]